jgi:hypothetical protein
VKYAVELGSCAMTYIPNFMKSDSYIQKFMGGGYKYRHIDKQTARLFHKPTFIFFQNKENMLKN